MHYIQFYIAYLQHNLCVLHNFSTHYCKKVKIFRKFKKILTFILKKYTADIRKSFVFYQHARRSQITKAKERNEGFMTLKELSAQSGVSIATISRILNNRAGVSQENLRKVTDAVREAGDEKLLKKLEAAGTDRRVIAVVVPDLSNPFFTAVIRGICSVMEKQNYGIIVCDTQESIDRELATLSMLKNMQITGLVITPTSDSDENGARCEAALKALKTPIILVDRDVQKSSFDGVFIDNERGALIGVSYLIQRGHSNIAVISGPTSSKPGRERLWGYKNALAQAGIALNKENIYEGDFSKACGYQKTCQILSRTDRPTAIFTCNNMMTLGCLQALRDHGLTPRTDIEVLSFDEIEDTADVSTKITCIRIATREMGEVAAEFMLERLGNNNYSSNRRINLIPELKPAADGT